MESTRPSRLRIFELWEKKLKWNSMNDAVIQNLEIEKRQTSKNEKEKQGQATYMFAILFMMVMSLAYELVLDATQHYSLALSFSLCSYCTMPTLARIYNLFIILLLSQPRYIYIYR